MRTIIWKSRWSPSKSRWSPYFFVLLIVGAALVTYGLTSWYDKKAGSLPVLLKYDPAALSFSLVNQEGRVITTRAWDDKIVVANLFFSHCPAICPKMIRNMAKLQSEFRDTDIRFASFSIDPENDSIRRLAAYALTFGVDEKNWDLLTGEKKAIYRLARQGFRVIASDGDGGPTDFIHSDKLILFDKNKQIRGYYQGTTDEGLHQLSNDIMKLRDEN